ncbi:MAG: ACT domain-containing protein [Clostridia bacterium]|nr:ACT domain-containing protein [Clostridia bacterium]
MKAVITVLGSDRVGIIAHVTNILAKVNVNILDISQTIMDKIFTMVMLVDLKEANTPFAEISKALDAAGQELGVSIRIQHEDIFNSMHRI